MKKGQNSRWQKVRSLFNTVHLWLGVGSALILFLVCLSGTIYTFSTEIQKVTDAELYTVAVPIDGKRLPAEKLINQLLDSVEGNSVQSIVIPEAANASYQITLGKVEPKKDNASEKKEGEKKGPPAAARARGTTYFIDPYTAKVLGTTETTSSAFFMFMFRLHRWLLLDMSVGRPIVGIATLIFVVIIISGLVIWFPKKVKNWRQGLTVKTTANWKRINHDLHNSLGLYASMFLLVMALTGLTWSFEWYKKGVNNAFGAGNRGEQKQFQSDASSISSKATIESYIAAANNALPYAGDYRFTLPADSAGVVNVSKTKTTFFATSVADRVTLDQYSAAVLNTEKFADKPVNEQILASMKALHIGSFAGTFSKIIYFIACLIGTSLPGTGVFIWLNKLRKKSKKKGRAALENEHSAAA